MRKRKRIKLGRKGSETILAAEWMDQEIIDNINLRNKYSRQWRYARKNKEPEEIINICKERYVTQQRKTSVMMGDRKSRWEEKKIEETWKDGKKFWAMIDELLGKNKKKEKKRHLYTLMRAIKGK